MGFFIAFISIFSALIGIYAFFKSSFESSIEKENFLIDFDLVKRRNERFKGELETFIKENEASEWHLMQGVSFLEALKMLEFAQKELFSLEKKYLLRRSKNIHSSREVMKQIKIHDKHLVESRNFFYSNYLGETIEQMLERVKKETMNS
ncbi:MAG: hypothetical protein BalsKO_23210 [Balneolaceae bacterium]